ncbi:hypothetical protein JHK87_056049 [Glycine soja]|nr:hypothetical protein JHK87_056049 [Glycine soja]
MPHKNLVTYNAMLSAYLRSGMLDEASRFFNTMPERNLHAQLIVNSWGIDDYDGRLQKGLVRMYSGFALMDSAHNVFEANMKDCDDQCFNSMINGYVQAG